MTAAEASGAGRRLTEDEERRGAELFAQGLSTRAVAAQLGVGNGTAARLKRRLAERAASRSEPEETTVTEDDQADAPEMTALPAADDAAELEQLAAQRQDLVTEVIMQADRAEASMQAVVELESERIRTLAEGRDAQALRQRRRDADDDARDFGDAARLASDRLEAVDKQIAAVQARIADAALRAELAGAVAERDRVLSATGQRQRLAVLAVRTAAEEFTQALADERAAVERVEQLAAQIALGGPMPAVPPAQSTGLWVHPDMANGAAPAALQQAMYQARNGSVREVATRLGTVFGWLPPGPAELAAEAERVRALHAPQAPPPAPRPVDMDPRFGASCGVDRDGRPLPPPPYDPERPRPQQVVRPGSLGFQPWPH